MDVSKLIVPKSDQLNADDLIGGPRTITITGVDKGNTEQPLKVFFEGDGGKPYKPGKSMMRVMVQVWGLESDDWVGQSLTIYNDPNVKFGGASVGGIRISHMTGLNGKKSFPLTVARARRSQYTVEPLNMERAPQVDAVAAIESAKDAARNGKASFSLWWANNKLLRAAVKPHMGDIEKLCDEAEASNESASDIGDDRAASDDEVQF